MASNITIGRFLNGHIGYKAVIDYIESKVIEQGCKSINDKSDTCAYRGNDGTKCGIGFIIPDSRYDERLDNSGVYGGTIDNVLYNVHNDHLLGINRDKLPSDEFYRRRDFLVEVQKCHDRASDSAGFNATFKSKIDAVRDQWKHKF